MGKRRRRGGRAAASPPSDGESSDAESVSGVWQLDEEQLRGKLRRQPIEPWQGRDEEIHACEESTRKNKERKASEAISANGCCQCFTVHMYLAVFVVVTAGLLLTAVGAGTAPRMTPANVFQKYQGVEECVMLRNGNLIPVSKWSGDPEELCKFSREKMEARAAKENPEPAPESEPEQEPSGDEGGKHECLACGRRFATQRGLGGHQARYCTGGNEEDDDDEPEEATEIVAARAFLGGLGLRDQDVADAAAIAGIDGSFNGGTYSNADRLVEKVRDEVEGLEGPALASKLSNVGATVVASATSEQRRAAYVLACVKRLVEPVLLARTYFWENGEFQLSQCEAYVRGLPKGDSKDKAGRLRKMIKGLDRVTTGLGTIPALQSGLVAAYEAKTPAVVEASKYNPFAAPKIEEVIAKHGEKLRGGADDDVVIEAVAETATRLLQQTKGGFMATTGSVVYVHTLWLLRLILSGRAVSPRNGKIFDDFKADTEGKREGYTDADGWRSAKGLKPGERAPYNHSEKFDEARHTLGEIVYGGNGTDGFSIVCFIIEGRKYFVLFHGREDYVLVNKVTMDCLAYFASLALPILLAEAADGRENAAGFLDSDDLPRIKDVLASERDERYNRVGFRDKWNAMTGFFDGYYADVLKAVLHKGGTITEAPGRLSAAAGGVGKQGECGGAGPEDHWHFDEEQVGNLILRLKGGGSGMCGGRDTGGGYGPDSDDDGGAAPTGSGPSGRGRAKRPKYDPFEGLDPWTPWNVNQVLVGVDGSGDGSGAG